MTEAKAQPRTGRPDAVLVTFDAKWYPELQKGVSAIIRKRVPKTSAPHLIYFHVNAPVGRIVARARIVSIERVPLSRALELRHQLRLSEAEIRSYFGGSEFVGAYMIRKPELAKHEPTLAEIRTRLIYNPPQSFLYLSPEGQAEIDRMCCFKPLAPRRDGEACPK